MFNWGKKAKTEEKTESIKDENKIELQESSSVTAPQTQESVTITPVEAEPVEAEPIEAEPIEAEPIEAEHIHDDNCKHQEEAVQQPPPLTHREAKYLKRSQYEKIAEKFNTSYVLKNTRTGQIVEIRAASSFHACNIIGWKPNRVKILSERKIEAPPQA